MKRYPTRAALLIFSTLFFIQACITSSVRPTERIFGPNLEAQYAEFRAEQVSEVRYELDIDLSDREYYEGTAKIYFSLNKNNISPLTLDFEQGEILSLHANGKTSHSNYEKWFIRIPADQLIAGENSVVVRYRRPYSSDGQGLHQYKDAETGNYYLYTQFQPYAANRLFPMFDQPNIRAKFKMRVSAPREWQVITATRETETSVVNETRQWVFPETQAISTYILPLHAGPYTLWEDQYKTTPLRLYARRELAEFVDPEEWFSTTKASFEFYENFFEYPYPFGKYDQLIVPDFNMGAMENVAAVTYRERFVSRTEKTHAQKFSLATAIAHEAAHMWFGNMVTMNWWNGLWLNESFATYVSYVALASMPEFENAWSYFADLKGWAYYEDQLVTTHPIEVPVKDSGAALSILDGISYAKGASVLRQLAHYVGQDNFQKALARYINEHQFKNTRLEDFADALESTSGKDMTAWVDQWLLQPGLNSVKVEYQCHEGILSGLNIHQSAPETLPTLRVQTVKVGLFNLQNEKMQLTGEIPVTYQGAFTEVKLNESLSCPDFVYPNVDDWGYLKVVPDQKAIQTLTNSIQTFEDAGLRLALWQSMWLLVHDAQLSIDKYLDFLDKAIVGESAPAVLNHVLFHEGIAFNLVESMSAGEKGQKVLQRIESLMWREFENSEPQSNRKKRFFDTAVKVSHSKQALARIHKLLSSKEVEGIAIDQELRWLIIQQLARYNAKNIENIIEDELIKDGSDQGQLNAIAARASRPIASLKQEWLADILNVDSTTKLSHMRAAMRHLFPGKQQDLRYTLADQIVSTFPSLFDQKDDMYFRNVGEHLLPANCTHDSVAKLQSLLDSDIKFTPYLLKKLKIAYQNDERCVRQREIL